jgi:hypothetical protein
MLVQTSDYQEIAWLNHKMPLVSSENIQVKRYLEGSQDCIFKDYHKVQF